MLDIRSGILNKEFDTNLRYCSMWAKKGLQQRVHAVQTKQKAGYLGMTHTHSVLQQPVELLPAERWIGTKNSASTKAKKKTALYVT